MDKEKLKQAKRTRRRNKIKVKIQGVAKRPRLSVFRSNREIYLQLIDDDKRITLVSARSSEIKKKDKKTVISFELGKLIAAKAADKKIKEVVFDRGGYKYHGRVKMIADGAREGGLKF